MNWFLSLFGIKRQRKLRHEVLMAAMLEANNRLGNGEVVSTVQVLREWGYEV